MEDWAWKPFPAHRKPHPIPACALAIRLTRSTTPSFLTLRMAAWPRRPRGLTSRHRGVLRADASDPHSPEEINASSWRTTAVHSNCAERRMGAGSPQASRSTQSPTDTASCCAATSSKSCNSVRFSPLAEEPGPCVWPRPIRHHRFAIKRRAKRHDARTHTSLWSACEGLTA